jgi:hypothetical protein
MKIDAYSHILPRAYFDRLVEIAPISTRGWA